MTDIARYISFYCS